MHNIDAACMVEYVIEEINSCTSCKIIAVVRLNTINTIKAQRSYTQLNDFVPEPANVIIYIYIRAAVARCLLRP